MVESHLPAAVLWDMDGTLVDTEPAWMEAEHELARAYGRNWSHEQALQLVGLDLVDAAEIIAAELRLELAPAEIVDYLLDRVIASVRRVVPWRPGARELLEALADRQVPQALVTMSYARFADPILQHLPRDTFGAVVTGDVVTNGKPHPEPYLRAAELLGVAAADCVAIEDSHTGARSAVAAGCRVIVVPNHVAVPPGDRRRFVDSLADLDPEGLTSVA